MTRQQRTLVGLAIACLSLMWVGCCIRIHGGPQARAQRQDRLSSAMGPESSLTVKTDFGSITVNGADTNECRVTAEVTANAPTQEEAQQILDQVKDVLEPAAGGLSLRVDKPSLGSNRSVGASFTVTVPRKTALDCHTSFGSITMEDIAAAVKAHTSFASVTANRMTGPLRLTTSHGAIRCDQVTSDNIMAESSFGNIDLTCTTPEANGAGAGTGSIDVRTSFGSITCRQLEAGRVIAHTSFGNVHMECLPSAPADMQIDGTTSHGSITCELPTGFAGQADMDTSFGEVRTERGILVQGRLAKDHLTGKIGDGKGRLRLKTEFGSITVR
jgi:hypothetical protein